MRLTEEDGGRVERFFGGLYSECEAGSLEVRGIYTGPRDGGRRSLSEWVSVGSAFGQARDFAKRLGKEGYDAFFMVNPVCRGGQEDKDVMRGVALFADIDNLGTKEAAEARLEEVLTFPIQPDAAVFSGNGLHLYSFLREGFDPAGSDWPIYTRALRSYARQFGGDMKCTNVSRVLRFPLSYSYKRESQTLLWLKEE